eukprot:TRINITY_DN6353_c0_g1_i2.p1 TRINITY_DN6353_c0_g1~~TRINITY_DN6353_c0_g1_i2.p1  ORF type:complete len:112 (+),score=23.67 TRINITY_DN6353_c0_g1_i2:108-443(+)
MKIEEITSIAKRNLTKKRIISLISLIVLIVLIVLFAIYYKQLLQGAQVLSDFVKRTPGAFLIVSFIVFVVSFPPGLGYGMTIIMSGFIWGWPWGIFPHLLGAFPGAMCCFW